MQLSFYVDGVPSRIGAVASRDGRVDQAPHGHFASVGDAQQQAELLPLKASRYGQQNLVALFTEAVPECKQLRVCEIRGALCSCEWPREGIDAELRPITVVRVAWPKAARSQGRFTERDALVGF